MITMLLTCPFVWQCRAVELGNLLMVAFETPTGIPLGTLNFKTLRAYNPGWAAGSSGLSEFGTEQARQGLGLSAPGDSKP